MVDLHKSKSFSFSPQIPSKQDNYWIKTLLGLFKRDDIKHEIKEIFTPLINLILVDIYPYIYLSLIFVIISFILHLGIFILLLKHPLRYQSIVSTTPISINHS
jgi:hypothetical protein